MFLLKKKKKSPIERTDFLEGSYSVVIPEPQESAV